MGSPLPLDAVRAPTPFFLSRADGMGDDYIAHAGRLATELFQTFSSLQFNEIEPPAARPWADVENIRFSEEIAWLADAAAALAEGVLRDLGIDPEPLRFEAEHSLRGGRRWPLTTVVIDSWTDGLGLRFVYGLVLQVKLESIFGSSYVRLANIGHELYFKLCQRDWPAVVGSPQRERVARAIEEDGREAVQRSIGKWWPLALQSIDDPEADDAAFVRLGLKTRDNAFNRASFTRIAQRELAALGLALPT